MRLRCACPALLLLAVAACGADAAPAAIEPQATVPALPGAPPASGSLTPPLPPADTLPPPPVLSPHEAMIEAKKLALLLRREVPHVIRPDAAHRAAIIADARAAITASGQAITRPQIVVVVDRNPRVQLMTLLLAMPDAPWQVLGGTRVSTGTRGRKFYYVTPTGVFANTDAILGYRAQGTVNEHGIRGNGVRGMRVWDFGWHEAEKGWLHTGETGAIRLELHATDPHFEEWKLGHPASEGCIRVSSAMNRFLDMHGVLDVDYERAAADDIRFRALLLPNRTPTGLAGNLLVVIDTGAHAA